MQNPIFRQFYRCFSEYVRAYFQPVCTALAATLLLAGAGLAQAETTGKTLIWEIKSGKQTGYILGSIHVAKPDFYPLPAHVEKAYKQAATVAVEVDASNEAELKKARTELTYGDSDKLENHVKPATFEKLKGMIGEAGIAQFQNLKPATAATGLSIAALTQLGYSTQAGIDLHYITRAKKDHKKLQELESIEFQTKLLGSMSDEEGDAMLSQSLDSIADGEAGRLVNGMVDAWRAGDAPGLAKLLEDAADKDAGSKKLMKLLFDDRNIGMAQKIGQMIKSGKRPFIVIGAGHMTGNNNILTLLEKQGFMVHQLP